MEPKQIRKNFLKNSRAQKKFFFKFLEKFWSLAGRALFPHYIFSLYSWEGHPCLKSKVEKPEEITQITSQKSQESVTYDDLEQMYKKRSEQLSQEKVRESTGTIDQKVSEA